MIFFVNTQQSVVTLIAKEYLYIRNNKRQIMNNTQTFLYSLLICFLLSCTSENEEQYAGNGSQDEINTDELAWFPLNGNLNDSTENQIHLFFNGTPEFVEAVDGSLGLKLDGKKNYISIPVGVQDTLSVIFYVKMDNPDFRRMNPFPVWLDYGMGAVKVTVDGTTDATKIKLTENTLSESETSQYIPEGEWENFCSWDHMVFFYTEIVKDKITSRIKARYEEYTPKEYLRTIELTSPITIKSDVLYIGRASGINSIENSYLQGIIDEIHIYNRGLTPEEIEYFAQQQ